MIECLLKDKEQGELLAVLQKLYTSPSLRFIMDYALYLATEKRLCIEIPADYLRYTQEGQCKIKKISGEGEPLFLSYQITILKNRPDVIIHELAHAIENEIDHSHIDDLCSNILEDVNKLKNINLLLRQKIKQVMIEDIRKYDKQKRISELWARYFELFACSRELMPEIYSTSTSDLADVFMNTREWSKEKFLPYLYQHMNSSLVRDYSIRNPPFNIERVQWVDRNSSKQRMPWQRRQGSIFDVS